MSLETRHITKIESTFTFFVSNADHGQVGITTDNDDFLYKNESSSRAYTVAKQHYFDGSYHYCDNEFKEVTLYGDLNVNSHIRLRSDFTNYLQMTASTISFVMQSFDQMTIGTTSVKIDSTFLLEYGGAVNEISNDDTMTDGSSSALCTEYAIKNYFDNNSPWYRNSGNGIIYQNTLTDLVGIGLNNPQSFAAEANDLVVGNTIGSHGLSIVAAEAEIGYLYFANNPTGGNRVGGFKYDHNINILSIITDDSVKLSIDNSGHLLFNNNINLGVTGDTDLLFLENNQLSVNGLFVVNGNARVNGNILTQNPANIGPITDPDLLYLTSNSLEIDGQVLIKNSLAIGATGIQADTRLYSRKDFDAVTSSSSNYWYNTRIASNICPISTGITDSGMRVGLGVNVAFNNSTFIGTLNNQYGLVIDYGHNSGCGAGHINRAQGLILSLGEGGAATIGESWGIKQAGAEFNYFEGKVRVGGSGTPAYPFEIAGLEELIQFTNVDYDAGTNLSSNIGWIKLKVDGTDRFIMLFSSPS